MDSNQYFSSSPLNNGTSLVVTPRVAGDAVTAPELFYRAWEECVELQAQPQELWVGKSLAALTDLDRYEVGIYSGDAFIGGLVVGLDDEVHVGPCMTVFSQYVVPEHRNKGVAVLCMRTAIRLTKQEGMPYLAYTHRVGDWRYETLYRRVL